MIVTIDELKQYLKIEPDMLDEDATLYASIQAAEKYIYDITGKRFDDNNELAKLAVKLLVSNWYLNREPVGKSEKLAFSLDSILFYLSLSESGDTA